jgi:error-prone DNA polymerase
VYPGGRERFADEIPPTVGARLEKVLALIAELEYEAYFLTEHDIVRYAK